MKFFFLSLFVATSVFGATYPVDQDIDALRAKAQYLEDLKDLLEGAQCSITLDSNTVALVPGALRSEGLVMAVGPGFPGNYLAYHKAPKPEQLRAVINYTLLKGDTGKGASIIGSRMSYGADGKPDKLVIFAAEPILVKGTDDLWMYDKTSLVLAISAGKVVGKVSTKTVHGQAFTLDCK